MWSNCDKKSQMQPCPTCIIIDRTWPINSRIGPYTLYWHLWSFDLLTGVCGEKKITLVILELMSFVSRICLNFWDFCERIGKWAFASSGTGNGIVCNWFLHSLIFSRSDSIFLLRCKRSHFWYLNQLTTYLFSIYF